ncbi:MAG: hypothetical protein U0521_13065 [Anaerolineae bacterium]
MDRDEAVSDPAFGEVTERLMKGDDRPHRSRSRGADSAPGGSTSLGDE